MQLKKIISILLPCFIVIGSVVGTGGYAYAEKRYDKDDRRTKETRQSSKKQHSDKRSQQKRDTRKYDTRTQQKRDSRKYDARRKQPGYSNRPDRHDYSRQPSRPGYDRHYRTHDRQYRSPSRRYYGGTQPKIEYYYRKGKRHKRIVVIPSRRHHDHYIYVRPFRHSYPHYRPLYYDNKLWGWLAFTLVTLQILDHLNDDQRREHEYALHRATRVPIGKTIIWSDDDYVSGSVTPVWEGSSDAGQYCREFRHEISIDDRTEIAYGTACRRQDGSWEIVQ